MRKQFLLFVIASLLLSVVAFVVWPKALWLWIGLGPVIVLGLFDFFQVKRSIPRNFPVIGHMRYLLELIRPEIFQYFVESDTAGVPFGRDQRSLVYARAKK